MQDSEEQLRQQAQKIVEGLSHKSTTQVKAELMALILGHGRLWVAKEDRFVDRIDHLNILLEYRRLLRRQAVSELCPREEAIADLTQGIGAANNGYDSGHVAPDWDFLMAQGLPGVVRRLKDCRKESHREYYDSRIAVYGAVMDCCRRWAQEARQVGNTFVAENMEQLAVSAPRTLAQAMQLTVLVYRLQTDLDECAVRSLGGLDHLYDPFYDPAREEEHRSLTRAFLEKLNSLQVAANIPFYVCDTAGNSWPYTWVLLEEYRKLGLYDPKIHVMYHPDLDKQLVRFVLDAIREGKNSFVFINTAVARAALEAIGVAPEDSRRLTVYGCYEPAAEGTEVPFTTASYVNMAKALELALYDGVDPLTGRRAGPQTGVDFADFGSFYEAVKIQLRHLTEQIVTVQTAHDRTIYYLSPSLLMSPTYRSSVESGVDLYAGGAKYNNTSIVGAALATLVDSVLAVKQVVYDRKLLSLGELTQVLKNNWAGSEKLRLICQRSCPRYGNNDPAADGYAKDLFEVFAGCVNGRKNGRGGVFRCGMFSVDLRLGLGRHTGATPDGRGAGEPLSKNIAASIGQDKRGVTALLSSMLKLDPTRIPDGAVADVVLHHSAVRGGEGMAAFEALLTTHMSRGGASVHFNVLSPEMLKKAQQEPEKYANLQIRLCGWNVRFVDLNQSEQEEFILQAEKYAM